MSYLNTTLDVYEKAAVTADIGLCCTSSPVWQLPGLSIPKKMLEMNYGCGTTVHPRDLVNEPKVLYVGIGGGMELLQFSYFSRRKQAIIGVDAVDKMIEACGKNLVEAKNENHWFDPDFIQLRKGDALNLPLEDNSIDLAAQNCLFNIFKTDDLKTALKEMYRVLRPHGKLVMSDPICEQDMNDELRSDDRLRALCLTGAIPLSEYIDFITGVGFGTIEVRARRAYRVLSPNHYACKELIFIESVEVAAIKDPMPPDGPCVFTGKNAIYFGNEDFFDDQKGHLLPQNQPIAVCDKTAAALLELDEKDIYVSGSTFFYDGGGCC